MKTIILFFVFAIAITTSAQNVGTTAPDFTLKNLNDQNYTLSQSKGKVVFIFFVGYSCPFCISSAPSVKSNIISEFSSNSKFEVLVIDTWDGSKTQVQNFKNTTGLDAVYLQKGKNVTTAWSITYDRLAVVDADGKIVFKGTQGAGSDVNSAKTAIQNALQNLTTGVNDISLSADNWLGQNFPNPVIADSKIEFKISKSSKALLSIHDITGKSVIIRKYNLLPAGQHEIIIKQGELNPGIYFYRLEAGKFSSTKKMVVQ